MHPSSRLRRAFTLVELLVVLAIIGLLIGLSDHLQSRPLRRRQTARLAG